MRTANIASFPSREKCLLRMLASIKGQFDRVNVYWNGDDAAFIPDWVYVTTSAVDGDLTDLGKFRFLTGYGNAPQYYFTLDDDIIYPRTYADDMVAAIDENECIVTHHGRRLIGKGRKYYSGHNLFRCLAENMYDEIVDVGGTGVMAFHTDYFRPLIWRDPRHKMADLVFAEAAAIAKKDILCLEHSADYFGYTKPPQTIHDTEQHNQQRLIDVADRIIDLQFDVNE